jgi:hypothetical protein
MDNISLPVKTGSSFVKLARLYPWAEATRLW